MRPASIAVGMDQPLGLLHHVEGMAKLVVSRLTPLSEGVLGSLAIQLEARLGLGLLLEVLFGEPLHRADNLALLMNDERVCHDSLGTRSTRRLPDDPSQGTTRATSQRGQ